MKRFSRSWLFVLVIGITAVVVWFLFQRENRRWQSEIAELNEVLESHKCLLKSRDEQLAHSRLGTSLLYRMALSGRHPELFAFLDAIPAGLLACKVLDLPEYPSIRLVWYSQFPKSLDGTWFSVDDHKHAFVIVQSNSLDVVDCVMHKGFDGVTKSMDEPYRTRWTLPDGTTVSGRILPTGFEQVE